MRAVFCVGCHMEAIFPYGRAFRMRKHMNSGICRGDSIGRGIVRSQACIVIVEPDELLRELLHRWLAEAGYDVDAAKDHIDPVVLPKLVIADISDPAGAGNTIQALQTAYAAPILALSARFRRGLAGSSEAAQRLHVGRVLPKPFTRDELLRAVREMAKLPRTEPNG